MTIQYSTTHRDNNVADITTQAGSTAYLLIYSGSVPTNCATTASGTLLASLPMSNPIAPAPSSGVLTMSAITSQAAGATGTAGYWRICTSSTGTTVVAQGTVGTSGADLNFPSVNLNSGETVSVSSFTITANGA
jgi:hypothetical protein